MMQPKNQLQIPLCEENLESNNNIDSKKMSQNNKTSNSTITTRPKSLTSIAFILFLSIFLLTLMPLPTNATLTAENERTISYPHQVYSMWKENVTYKSSTDYNSRGMAPLYNLTNNFIMKLFFGPEAIPKGYVVVTDMQIKLGEKVTNNEWGDFLKHYWAVILIVVVTVLVVVLTPIIGLCFCCCRCAGACGARTQPFDKKYDMCKRVLLGLILICVASAMLFGVIVSFATNAYMQEGINEMTTTVRTGSNDIKKFLGVTSKQMDNLLVDNYKKLVRQLDLTLKSTSNLVIEDLERESQAVSLKHLQFLIENFPVMKQNLERMKHITNELRVNASQLSDGLRGVKRDLLVMLTKCQHPSCREILEKYEVGKLDANGIDYNQLPDLSAIISSVDDLVQRDIASVVQNGQRVLGNMRKRINETMKTYTPEIIGATQRAGYEIEKWSKEITRVFNQASNVVGNHTNYSADMADRYLNEYSVYRLNFGLIVCTLLLLILTFITCGLFCGICGKRAAPDGYDDDCCTKGTGTRFLSTTVTLIFLTTSVLATVALVHFLLGLILHRGVCVPLQNPANDDVFQYIDNFVDLNNILYSNNNNNVKSKSISGTLPPFRISHVITSCKANHTIYEVLRLHNHMDIKDFLDYPNTFDIDKKLDGLVEGIQIDTTIKILDDADKERILYLANSDLGSFDKDKFTDNLNEKVTSHSLSDLAKQLRDTAAKIPSNENMTDVRVILRNQALHLETYQDNLVTPMTEQSKELIDLATRLEATLRYKGKPFDQSIIALVTELENAQDFINNRGKEFITVTAKNLTKHFKSEIDNYLKFVITSVQQDVGKCEPIAKVYDSAIITTCNKFIDPLNGFWAGVAWCVILFLPALYLSVKLASLYQKSEPYPGPLVETSLKNKRRKNNGCHHNRRRSSRDRRAADYYEDSESSYGAGGVMMSGAGSGVSGRDTRYSDMAPKHWDGGPPRYSNPPIAPPSASEYERPPPYYYPGTSESAK